MLVCASVCVVCVCVCFADERYADFSSQMLSFLLWWVGVCVGGWLEHVK